LRFRSAPRARDPHRWLLPASRQPHSTSLPQCSDPGEDLRLADSSRNATEALNPITPPVFSAPSHSDAGARDRPASWTAQSAGGRHGGSTTTGCGRDSNGSLLACRSGSRLAQSGKTEVREPLRPPPTYSSSKIHPRRRSLPTPGWDDEVLWNRTGAWPSGVDSEPVN
jgi:hypothetical protein